MGEGDADRWGPLGAKALARAHVLARAGNVLLSYRLDKFDILENVQKNHSYCVLALSGYGAPPPSPGRLLGRVRAPLIRRDAQRSGAAPGLFSDVVEVAYNEGRLPWTLLTAGY